MKYVIYPEKLLKLNFKSMISYTINYDIIDVQDEEHRRYGKCHSFRLLRLLTVAKYKG